MAGIIFSPRVSLFVFRGARIHNNDNLTRVLLSFSICDNCVIQGLNQRNSIVVLTLLIPIGIVPIGPSFASSIVSLNQIIIVDRLTVKLKKLIFQELEVVSSVRDMYNSFPYIICMSDTVFILNTQKALTIAQEERNPLFPSRVLTYREQG